MYSRGTDRGGRRIKLPPGYDGSTFRHDTGELRRYEPETEMKIHSPASAAQRGERRPEPLCGDGKTLTGEKSGTGRNLSSETDREALDVGYRRQKENTGAAVPDRRYENDREEWHDLPHGMREQAEEIVEDQLYDPAELSVSGTAPAGDKDTESDGTAVWDDRDKNAVQADRLLAALGSEEWLLLLVILLLVADGSDAWDTILILGLLLAVKGDG